MLPTEIRLGHTARWMLMLYQVRLCAASGPAFALDRAGMVLIVLGVVFDGVSFGERSRTWIAAALVAGSFVFPLGVILQTVSHGASYTSGLAILGSAIVTMALAAVAWGFAREQA